MTLCQGRWCCGAAAHGGANEAVIKMLESIGSKENIPDTIRRAKDKSDPFRLMGFGHRFVAGPLPHTWVPA